MIGAGDGRETVWRYGAFGIGIGTGDDGWTLIMCSPQDSLLREESQEPIR